MIQSHLRPLGHFCNFKRLCTSRVCCSSFNCTCIQHDLKHQDLRGAVWCFSRNLRPIRSSGLRHRVSNSAGDRTISMKRQQAIGGSWQQASHHESSYHSSRNDWLPRHRPVMSRETPVEKPMEECSKLQHENVLKQARETFSSRKAKVFV